MQKITVIGAGLAGLTAAIAAAEGGAQVVVHEAHREIGGRARATPPPYIAHEGGHAFYADGPHWTWLTERDLVGPTVGLSMREGRALRLRWHGGLRRLPPAELTRVLLHRRLRAPVDQDFHSWAGARFGAAAARTAANALGVVTYDHDPGRLSAAFVWDLLLRVSAPQRPVVRYVIGGWPRLIERMRARAAWLGVRIETGSRVHELPDPPVIVATQLEAAGRLLGQPDLSWESGRTALLDLGLRAHPDDLFAIFDLDEAGVVARLSGPDPTLAPEGHSLLQAMMPLRPGEPRDAATARLEALVDLGFPAWRERVEWRRDAVAAGRSGALDLPGRTWRDRPAVERGGGVFLAGDLVAAPGMRGEVSINSGLLAAGAALRHAAHRPAETPISGG
jgi:phytoene dehydrogenase-like protein